MTTPLLFLQSLFPPSSHGRVALVGGTVRDMLRGRESQDIDLVVALPHEELCALGFRLVEPTSATTIYFKYHPEFGKIEATRIDSMNDLEGDLIRRDFSINAMAMDLSGVRLDPLCGEEDLKAGVLRACSDHTFADDPLRIFRAFRFEADSWRMAPDTAALIRKDDWSEQFCVMPVERFSGEMLKALARKDPARFFHRMIDFNVGAEFLPEIFRMPTIPAGPPQHHPEGDLFTHSIQVLQRVANMSDAPLARFCALFHDLGKLATDPALYPKHHGHDNAGFSMAVEFCNRLRLPATYRKALAWVSSLHGKANKWHELRNSSKLKMAEQAFKGGIIEILPLIAAADKAGGLPMTGWEDIVRIAAMSAQELGIDQERLEAIPGKNRSAFILQKRGEILKESTLTLTTAPCKAAVSKLETEESVMMIEEHVYARPVRDFCRKELILCSVDDGVQEEAAIMAERGISSVVVCREGVPVGIFTDRDLRNKVVAIGGDPCTLRAGAIMSAPLIVVQEDYFLFEAVYQMTRHGIHRLGVVAADGRLCGMLTESDLIRAQSDSPQQLVRQLESARSVADLKEIHHGINSLTLSLHQVGVPTHDLMRLISHLNDQIVQRLIILLRSELFPQLPAGFAFVVMGSEGRREQTLKTDQDNAMIYADDLKADDVAMLATFSEALIEGLVEIGVPECPGGIMAKNRFWRRSLTEWMEAVDEWISEPESESILHFCMFCDLRTLAGDPALEQAIKSHIAERAQHETLFLMQLAVQAGKFTLPLGFFGGFKVEKVGDHRGEIDIKSAGLFAITEGIRALGLAAGLVGGGTPEKMVQLQEKGELSHEQREDLQASFNMLCQLRLQGQMEAIARGGELSNYIAPAVLNRVEQGRLHVTLEVVKSFEAFIRYRFRLDVVPG